MTLDDRLLPRCRFPAPGTPVVCGWSGGADSTALVVLAQAAGCVVSAVFVDHGLRPDSQHDIEIIRVMAEARSVPLRVVGVDVEDGPNLEARARQARHSVLPADSLLGHTADDQAETVLLQLGRGAGPDGLRAMGAGRRPLLGLRRRETAALCDELRLRIVEDPTNFDPRFRRNRVRHELVPALADIFERDPVPVLARAARHQHDIVELLDELSASLDVPDTRVLREAHPAVARHGLRRWLQQGTGSPYGADEATIDRVMAVVRHERRATEVGAGWRVDRRRGRIRLEHTTAAEQALPTAAR